MRSGAEYVHGGDCNRVPKVQQGAQAVQKRQIERCEAGADQHKALELRRVASHICENPVPCAHRSRKTRRSAAKL